MSGELILHSADPEEVERFRVLIDSRTRHADLWPLVREVGSAKALADLVGFSQSELGRWINLKAVPSLSAPAQMRAANELALMCDKTFDGLWPAALREAVSRGVASVRREHVIETWERQLVASQAERLILPSPAESAEEAEINQHLREALNCLTAREREIVQCRLFDNKTLGEAGKQLGVTQERIRQLEMRAIRKLKRRAIRIPVLRDIVEQMGKLNDPEFGAGDDLTEQ